MVKKIIIKKKIPERSRETVLMQTTQTTTEVQKYDLEDVLAGTLNVLFEGMARGNQVDKKAAEALIKSIKYKTNEEFYDAYLKAYEEALQTHEAVFGDTVVNKITKNITAIIEQNKQIIKKITQQIILNPPDKQV